MIRLLHASAGHTRQVWKARFVAVEQLTTIVGHLAPDLDCLTAIWILVRFGGARNAALQFVPAGQTLHNRPADEDPHIIHVDTGGGQFDHHTPGAQGVCAAELVRRSIAPDDEALARLVAQVNQIDNASAPRGSQGFFNVNALVNGYNLLFPNRPHHVAYAMLPNLDAWYEHEQRQIRLERAFARRIEFDTPWGLGIALDGDDGGSGKLAYRHGAVLYAYRNEQGWMGIAARSRSNVDLSPVYHDLQIIDHDADWYLHPGKRMLLCGTPKAPPRSLSRLTLDELVRVIQGEALFLEHSSSVADRRR
ncbi:conserved hypothetical protein [Roseiflexus castenholzii DSM 13941]|uniref:Uncharacterized protein n=1 Tax=Roseiflexus castenholzii (strain DSM 13941 / HLO8) TaxID=383372 RepID=A7NKT2_ROSCS|nr:conserved hypothetical protein [Roseiflexus castenholzii DSM 13941]